MTQRRPKRVNIAAEEDAENTTVKKSVFHCAFATSSRISAASSLASLVLLSEIIKHDIAYDLAILAAELSLSAEEIQQLTLLLIEFDNHPGGPRPHRSVAVQTFD